MALRSLRSRLILGSVVWAGGLLFAAFFIAAAGYHRHPEWAYELHNGLLTLFAVVCVVVSGSPSSSAA